MEHHEVVEIDAYARGHRIAHVIEYRLCSGSLEVQHD